MKRTALVIDDDVFCLDIAVEYLSDKEFDITSSLTPTCPMIEQKLETCPMETHVYDIVLSDNHMPVMTGLELFELQRHGGCKVPPSHKALISGDISAKDQGRAENISYKVFRKPTSLDLLDSWIDEVMGQRSSTENR